LQEVRSILSEKRLRLLPLGGTAGCVIAARLAEANAEASILVVESGSKNNALSCTVPALFLANLSPETGTSNLYLANKTKQIAGREVPVVTGGVLGGGSSINVMMYSRAQRADFDSWNVPGWSADDMLAYLKKVFNSPSGYNCKLC
jgi:alcohol oxidase